MRWTITSAIALGLVAAPAAAFEGKWTPEQVLQLDAAKLRAEGLRIPPRRLWDEKRGTGLLAGAVNVSGCSGAFISRTGLVITNHHCVFSIIQEHTTPERNLIEGGFLARSKAEELPGKGARLQVPRRFTDVTAEVLAAVPAGADDLARFRALERKQKELVAACEAQPAARCQVAVFDGGLRYTLIEAMELSDVRLVYAPPRGVGEYGGEIDNWSWPRHTGDFGIVRGYVAPDGKPRAHDPANVPVTSEHFFPLSSAGVGPEDFVMVLGYPGRTERALLADEMEKRRDRWFPRIIDVYGENLRIMEEVTDAEGKIALATLIKSQHNRVKNARGQLAGIARGRLIEKQRAAEEAVVTKAKNDAAALAARTELLGMIEDEQKVFERELLLFAINAGSRALWLASTIARLSTERAKPDLERDPQFMDRELPRLRDRLEREQKNLFVPADQRLLVAWVRRAQALGPGERIDAVDRIFGANHDERAVAKKVQELFASTKLLGLETRREMVGATPEALRARKDPLLDLGFAIAAELDRLKETQDRRAGAGSRLRPAWRKAVLASHRGPVSPDANGTLRVSFGKVRGYVPRDGVLHTPQTTLSGMLAKDTGEEPFDLPPRVKQAALAGDGGRWKDRKLGDVPLCFTSDVDTTGGNSGSPMVNGKGELVGVNFDRVWENVANDYGYNPDIARNISVDVRFVLWMLDRVEHADELLAELGVKR